MKNKTLIGLFSLIILVILSYFIFENFLKKKDTNKKNSNSLEEKSFTSNTIKDVSYLSKDTKGNEYIINASTGEIDINNSDVIYLTNVKAEINLENSNKVVITSEYGKYNTKNFDTIFSKNVIINYLANKITGEYLDFSLERNLMVISRDIVYTNPENILLADVLEMNIQTNYPIYLRTKKFKVGYVPQYGGYFNELTLHDNLKAISEIVIDNKNLRSEKINYLLSKFELENVKEIKAKFLSGGQKKKLVIALSLLSDPKVLLLDECFAALDVLTIKMLQEIIVNLQQETQITICICDHQARDLLACVDVAMILSNCKIIAQDTPNNLVNDINAKNAYFGESFKFN